MRRRQIFARMAEAAKAAFFTPAVHESEVFTEREQAENVNRCECGKVFPTAQGLKVHKGRAHK